MGGLLYLIIIPTGCWRPEAPSSLTSIVLPCFGEAERADALLERRSAFHSFCTDQGQHVPIHASVNEKVWCVKTRSKKMFYAAVVLILAGTVGQPASGEGSSGDDLGSGDLMGSGDSGGAFMGSGENNESGAPEPPLIPPLAPPPAFPPPEPSEFLVATDAAHTAGPVFTLSPSASGADTLLVDAASKVAAVPPPFLIRIACGLKQQEDLVVTAADALHGFNKTFANAPDGRFAFHLGSPARYAHGVGESLRLVDRQAILRTTFKIYHGEGALDVDGGARRLFDATIVGPDAPHIHSEGEPLDLQLADITADGMHALRRHHPTLRPGMSHAHHDYGDLEAHETSWDAQQADPSVRALLLAMNAAIRGWAAFGFEPAIFAAATVAIRLISRRGGRHGRGGGGRSGQAFVLSRGGGALLVPDPKPLRPLAGALDLANSRGYWTNISEAGSGWVAALPLDDFPHAPRGGALGAPQHRGFGAGSHREAWPAGRPQPMLTAEERQLLGVGPVNDRYGSELYARYTPTSELGVELQGRGLTDPSGSATTKATVDAMASSDGNDYGQGSPHVNEAGAGDEAGGASAVVQEGDLVEIEYEILS